jgi:hypothetical protein
MKEDLKIFFKYIFDINEFGRLIKDSFKQLIELKNLSQLCLIISILLLALMAFKKVDSNFLNWFWIIGLFILSLYFRYYIVYKGGEHRKWYRDKKGIPSKKELLREEFDLRRDDKKEN